MDRFEHSPDDYVLDEAGQRIFDQIRVGLAKDEGSTPSWRHSRVVRWAAGGLGVGAAMLATAYVTEGVAADHAPTTAEVRAAAFRDPQVLLQTGTCQEELTYEKERLDPLASRGTAADRALHPDALAYARAITLAKQHNVPCAPIGDTAAIAGFTMDGMNISVSGGSTVPASPETTPLLDAGSDVLDTCILGTPQVDTALNRALAAATGVFVQTAEQYCPTPPATGK